MVSGHKPFRSGRLLLVASAMFCLFLSQSVGSVMALAPASSYDWLQFGGSSQHQSNNTLETTITPSNVNTLKMLFQVALPSSADNAPVYLRGVTTPTGIHDLLFLTTLDGHALALDARTGTPVWTDQYPAGSCQILRKMPCYTTAAPAIDPGLQYVYSYGLDGFVHKLAVGDGTEVTGNGWPEVVTLKRQDEKVSTSLSFATATGGLTYLYVKNAGFHSEYQGHLTSINLTDGSQKVFNTLCSNQTVHFVAAPGSPDCNQIHSGSWGRSGPLYDPNLNRIDLTTGDALWNPATHMWGDSVLELHPDGTGANGGPVDSYTPVNQSMLNRTDKDLGGTDPVLLPVPSQSTFQHVAVQGGKDDLLRLINLDNLSGKGGPGFTGGEISKVAMPEDPHPLFTTGVRSQPAVWVNPVDQTSWVFVTNDNGVSGFQVQVNGAGTPSLAPKWRNGNKGCKCQLPDGNSPLVANGVLFVANPNDMQALNPIDGTILWQDTHIGSIHWSSPVVANGVLYITDRTGQAGKLTAYSLGGILPAASVVAQ